VVAPSIPILPYDEAAADWHARERARLLSEGRKPPFADGQIAAIAKVHDLAIVTANVRDFEAFEGITVEDWLGAT
jgi:tRNA(fMet)-specific endonuclease VapC